MAMVLCETHLTVCLVDEDYAYALTVTIDGESKTLTICEDCLAAVVQELEDRGIPSTKQEDKTLIFNTTVGELK